MESTAATVAPAAPAAPAAQGIPCTILGKNSTAPFPMIQDVWHLFAKKGIRTVFLSIGTSASSSVDLEIAESIGCPLHIVAPKDEEAAGWTEIGEILKTRKRDPAVHTNPFSEGAETRWMLPKNMRILREIPWWSAGSMRNLPTQECVSMVESVCKGMKLPEDQTRLDILKVDMTQSCPGLERPILSAILEAGFRPSILMVRWTEKPTTNLATTHAAGHLQIMGYQLISMLDNAFLYYYTDKDLFQICSWEDSSVENPFIKEIVETIRPSGAAAPGTSLSTTEGEAT